MIRQGLTSVCGGAVLAFSASMCFAQASYTEDFESMGSTQAGEHGPSGLIASGWIFRNQSDPEGSGSWHQHLLAYQGALSLGIDVSVSFWDGGNAEASSSASRPELPGQIPGDGVRVL